MLLKMPNPIHASLVYSLAIFSNSNYPIAWKSTVLILRCKVIFAYNNDEWQYCLALGVDALDYCNPFPITRLHLLCFCTPV